ncbi:MAG: hypothetical protein A2085_00385 [Gemmatimonadetes bacterium GWC2_71_10]|nr:MAG: hypothetical protein A2085_00385 [Gemmatimonadetes bacterium GWC2_71_10]
MRFWDTSGLVAVCANDGHVARAAPLLESDPDVMVWWGTRLECVSAVRKLRRDGELNEVSMGQALERLDQLRAHWSEVAPSAVVRVTAERLLHRHVLFAADALQLAAALEWAGEGGGAALVSFDQRLARAAAAESFVILPG